jgi:hypothetical protein
MKVEVLYARLVREEAKKTHHRGAKDTKDLPPHPSRDSAGCHRKRIICWLWVAAVSLEWSLSEEDPLCSLCLCGELVKRKTGTLRMPVQSSHDNCWRRLR